MSSSFLIIGASGHGRVLADAVRAGGGKVIGFVDDSVPVGTLIDEAAVLGGCEDLPVMLKGRSDCVSVIGVGDNCGRRRCIEKIRALVPGLAFPPVVHPSAVVASGVELGEGAVVLAGAVVGTGSRVGAFTILNTRSSLDHHSALGDFASLAPGATTGGAVDIGAGAAVGLGAGILQGRKVGADTVVGAMALVYHDLPERVVAMGVPAKVVSARDFSKPYLSRPISRVD